MEVYSKTFQGKQLQIFRVHFVCHFNFSQVCLRLFTSVFYPSWFCIHKNSKTSLESKLLGQFYTEPHCYNSRVWKLSILTLGCCFSLDVLESHLNELPGKIQQKSLLELRTFREPWSITRDQIFTNVPPSDSVIICSCSSCQSQILADSVQIYSATMWRRKTWEDEAR